MLKSRNIVSALPSFYYRTMNPSASLTATAAPTSEAATLIDNLRAQADTLLTAETSQNPLVSFGIGSEGNFPYYWQSSKNLLFNANTYNWIRYCLQQGEPPVQLSTNYFPNQYIEVLSSVSFQLSTTEEAQLSAAATNASQQQTALLLAWQSAYGSLPPATTTQQPIDVIMSTIATTWAQPATNLEAIQTAPNLSRLLNNTPASGEPIRPVLAQYLQALGSSISLQNQTTMNNGYLQTAMYNVQSAAVATGGILLSNGSATAVPAYTVTPVVTTISNALASGGAATLAMTVVRTSESEVTVSVSGETSFSIPIGDFFGISTSDSASYFSDSIATSSNTVQINMSFPGVNLVNFGPAPFDLTTGLNWFWIDPITQAIQNGTQDKTGFKFIADYTQPDFSKGGSFGYLSGVAISSYPTITVTVTSSDYQSIATTFQQQSSVGISFMGINLASGTESYISHSVQTNASASSVTITLAPPVQSESTPVDDQLAWIMGVQPCYPAAS